MNSSNFLSSEHVADIAGIPFHYRIDGSEGRPWLVFSNSLMTDLRLWDRQVAALGREFRILRYDQRGHGRTGMPADDCSFEQLSGDLLELLDRLGIAKVGLVGISMGAATAICLAGRHGGRIDRLVLADGMAAAPPAGALAWEERIAIARTGGMQALCEPTLKRWFLPDFVAAGGDGLRLVAQMIGETPLEGFVRCARALQSYDLRSELDRLDCPVLLMAGAADGQVPDTMRAMAQRVSGARFIEIPDAGHLPNIEQPKAFNEALVDFLLPQ